MVIREVTRKGGKPKKTIRNRHLGVGMDVREVRGPFFNKAGRCSNDKSWGWEKERKGKPLIILPK